MVHKHVRQHAACTKDKDILQPFLIRWKWHGIAAADTVVVQSACSNMTALSVAAMLLESHSRPGDLCMTAGITSNTQYTNSAAHHPYWQPAQSTLLSTPLCLCPCQVVMVVVDTKQLDDQAAQVHLSLASKRDWNTAGLSPTLW